jgi:hypothetical protein
MPQRGASAKVTAREYEVWLDDSDDGGWATRSDDRVAMGRTGGRRTVTIKGDGTSGYYVANRAQTRHAHLTPVRAADPQDMWASAGDALGSADHPHKARVNGYNGAGSAANHAPAAYRSAPPDRRRARKPRYERAGFRPDRAAMWAVVLCLVLLLVAATSSRGAVPSVGGPSGSARTVAHTVATAPYGIRSSH